jgi:hypothetical protein
MRQRNSAKAVVATHVKICNPCGGGIVLAGLLGAIALALEGILFWVLQEWSMDTDRLRHPVMGYVITALRLWGKHISGPALAVVAIVLAFAYAHYANEPTATALVAKYGALVTGIAAVCLMFVAQYGAWKGEHDERIKAQSALDTKADIRGTIWVNIPQYNPLQDQNKDGSALRLKCRCVNHGHRSCQISRFRLVVSGTDLNDVRMERPLPMSFVQTVGYGEQFVCEAGPYTIHDVGLTQLNCSAITIHLMDSLGTEYTNTDTRVIAWPKEFDRL